MSATVSFVGESLRELDDVRADVLVLTAFSDEQPLEGLAGLVDWRLLGAVSRWFIGGFASGSWGERVLYPAGHRLSHPRLLLLGLGARSEHRTDRALRAARGAVEATVGLGATSLTCGLFGLDRLPSPLRRTGPQLLELLSSSVRLERVVVVAQPDQRKVLTGEED